MSEKKLIIFALICTVTMGVFSLAALIIRNLPEEEEQQQVAPHCEK